MNTHQFMCRLYASFHTIYKTWQKSLFMVYSCQLICKQWRRKHQFFWGGGREIQKVLGFDHFREVRPSNRHSFLSTFYRRMPIFSWFHWKLTHFFLISQTVGEGARQNFRGAFSPSHLAGAATENGSTLYYPHEVSRFGVLAPYDQLSFACLFK